MPGFIAPRSPNEDYWRKKLAGQGSVSAPPRSVERTTNNGLFGLFKVAGMSDRSAQRLANRATSALRDLSPVGTAVDVQEGSQRVSRGVRQRKAGETLAGVAQLAMAVIPNAPKKVVQQAAGPLKQLFGIKAYHGGRAFEGGFDLEQAGSGLGYADERAVWFTPDKYEANRYAWSVDRGGTYEGKAVYPALIDHADFDEVPPMAYDPEEFARILEEARKANRPGVIFRSVKEDDRLSRPVDQIAVLNPNRIKPPY